jgi:hypothetical protein
MGDEAICELTLKQYGFLMVTIWTICADNSVMVAAELCLSDWTLSRLMVICH